MSIKQISKGEFSKYFRHEPGSTIQVLTREVAWFASENATVIGSVLLDNVDKDWSYVVLGPDERGDYRCIEMDASFDSQNEATDQLRHKMQGFIDSGETSFPQDD